MHQNRQGPTWTLSYRTDVSKGALESTLCRPLGEYMRLKFLRDVGFGSSFSVSFCRKSAMFTQPYVRLPPTVVLCASTLMILPAQRLWL